MALTPYTTNDQVRSVLGVKPEVLDDTTLGLELYSKVLKMELDAIADNGGPLAAAFSTIAAKTESSRTTNEARLYDAVTMFSPYPVALQFETSLPLLAPKQVTDGKAAVTLHAEAPFKAIMKAARDNYERFRTYLISAWAKYNSSNAAAVVAVPTLFAVSKPSTDRVKG